MPEITHFLQENRRTLLLLGVLALLSFSSAYVLSLEGRQMAGDVEERARSISYKRGYQKGESRGYEAGLEEGKKEAYQKTFRTSYRTSYLEQFKKAGIKEPPEVPLP